MHFCQEKAEEGRGRWEQVDYKESSLSAQPAKGSAEKQNVGGFKKSSNFGKKIHFGNLHLKADGLTFQVTYNLNVCGRV